MGKKEWFRQVFALPKGVEMLLLRKGQDSGHWFAMPCDTLYIQHKNEVLRSSWGVILPD